MASFRFQLGSYPADLGAATHTPKYPEYAGYHTGNQQSHSPLPRGLGPTEFSSLKLQMSILQYQLSERDKDITEARTVIAYLLKLNARDASRRNADYFNGSVAALDQVTTAHAAVETGKDVFGTVVDSPYPKAGALRPTKTIHQDAGNTASPVCGDLLDMSDEHLALGILAAEKICASQRPSDVLGSVLSTHPLPMSTGHASMAATDQSNSCSNEMLDPELDGFATLSYVARFTHARSSTAKGAVAPSTKTLHVLDECNEDFKAPHPSLDDLDSRLSGSTKYAGSESNGLRSLNSSFTSSEDETDECVACPPAGHHPKLENAKGGLKQSSCKTPSAGVSTSLSDGTPDPVQERTTLFTPKWSVKPFAMSPIERENAIYVQKQSAGVAEYLFPDFFRYGIRFRPDPMETDIYRTVLVDNLPAGLTVFALLQFVKSGAIENVKSVDTTNITGHLSALITFIHEKGARAFDQQARRTPLVFAGVTARVTLLPTPTYPMTKKLQIAITKHAHTRCLEVKNFPRGVAPAELERDLRVCQAMTTHRIVSKKMRSDGVLELGFASVNYAGLAYAVLKTWRRYQGCRVVFVADPCAGEAPGRVPPAAAAVVGAEVEATPISLKATAAEEKDYHFDHEVEPPAYDLIDLGADEDSTGRLNHRDDDDEESAKSSGVIRRGRGFSGATAAAAAPRGGEGDACCQQ
ncbi:MAG: hypothetical protein Q9210_006367 [Variospora velana]